MTTRSLPTRTPRQKMSACRRMRILLRVPCRCRFPKTPNQRVPCSRVLFQPPLLYGLVNQRFVGPKVNNNLEPVELVVKCSKQHKTEDRLRKRGFSPHSRSPLGF